MYRPHPQVLTVLGVVFVDVLGLTVMIPLLPFYAQHFGATPAGVGALIATYAAGSLVMGPLLGRGSDRYGRRPVLMLSQAGSLLGFVLLALAPALWWLFVARAIDGLSAGNLPAARAYIADRTPPEHRAAAFGWIAAAFGLAFMVGPAIAALLSPLGLAAPLWASAGLASLSLLGTTVLLREAPRARVDRPAPDAGASVRGVHWLRGHAASRPLWQLFGFFVAFSAFTAGFALFAERRLLWQGAPFGTTEVGLALAFTGALGLIAQVFLLGPLVRRWGEARLARACLGLVAVAYLGLGWSPGLVTALGFLAMLGLCNSLLRPALMGLLSRAVAPHQQGLAFGISQSLQALATLLAPLAAGGLIHLGWLAGWGMLCAAGAIAAALAGRGATNQPQASGRG